MNRFLMRRVFRLYPPFLFCLLFYSLIQIDSTSLKFILEESTLIRKRHVLYPPDWTLGVELAMSLFVPFLIIILIKCQRLFIWFIIMTSLIGDSYVSKFILLFGLGVLLAKNFEKIQTYKCNHWLYRNKHYLLPLLILPFSYKHITHLFPLPNFVNYTLENILEINEFTLSGVSSFLLLLYIINSQRIQKLLSAKILVFIGKVSYGVYLSHWFFTLIILKHMDFILATWTNNSKVYFLVFYLSTTLLGSILAGWLIYRFIEIPFIAYSKRLQKKLSAVVWTNDSTSFLSSRINKNQNTLYSKFFRWPEQETSITKLTQTASYN